MKAKAEFKAPVCIASGKGRTRSNFTLPHLITSVKLQNIAFNIEDSHKNDKSNFPRDELRSYVSGSIILAYAAVEANINEFFEDANSRLPDIFEKPISEILTKGIKINTLDKYQISLQMAHKTTFDKSRQPYQDVFMLKQIRNEFVHFIPAWKRNDEKLEAYFKGKIEVSTYWGEKAEFVPKKCMTSSMASWAVKTAISFIDAFDAKMKIVLKLDKHRSKLKVLS
jgi:hypothetical protein